MAEPKQVVVFPRGQLSDKDRRALGKAGVCVVEADDPSKVVMVLPLAPVLSGDDVLRSAIGALAGGSGGYGTLEEARTNFVKGLVEFAARGQPSA